MKSLSLPVCLLLSCFAFGSWAADRPDAAERKRLVGVWKGFAVEGMGEQPDRGAVKLELRITERAITGLEFKGGGVIEHGTGEFVLDLSANPKVLDAWKATPGGRKQSYVGIYSLEADTLKWCVSPRKTRPGEFRTGNGSFLLVLKRQPQ